ncbi:hypothetical protein [Deinococcus marmoris]|uniref:hypothetical protein n=1 Tax=Deinococcus marmoris TaxID=249408 RepID=UPI00111538FE|nr:hypothetical protein [Deinococcus marmoris]
MTKIHHARLRADLKRDMAIDRVLTTVQLERRGLLKTAEQMGLTLVERTCRTRVNQPGSLTDLTFVLDRPELAGESSAALMHWAGLAEHRFRTKKIMSEKGADWRLLDLKGRGQHHLPDAALRFKDGHEWAVELDTGYPPATIKAKLRAASATGYTDVMWTTTTRSRVVSLRKTVTTLDSEGLLPGLNSVMVFYVDFWCLDQKYGLRPYSTVPVASRIELRRARGRGSGARVGTPPSSAPGGSR